MLCIAAVASLQAAFKGKLERSRVCGQMFVTALRGLKLADRELFGKQDPYVVASLLEVITGVCDSAGVCAFTLTAVLASVSRLASQLHYTTRLAYFLCLLSSHSPDSSSLLCCYSVVLLRLA